jgi:acetyl-CoA acetyltransferase
MGIGPVFAIPKLLKQHGLKIDDIDLWELNEPFASQALYCRDRLGIDPEKFNVNGGGISIGHPYGMRGARLVGHALSRVAAAVRGTSSSRCALAAVRTRLSGVVWAALRTARTPGPPPWSTSRPGTN